MARTGGVTIAPPSWGFLDFWCLTPINSITLPAVAADVALPSVVIASLPSFITVLRADPVFKWGLRNNSNAAVNKLSGDQYIQISPDGVTYTDCLKWVDDMLWTDASSLGPGDIRVGIDMSAIVTGNGTYQFRWHNALVDGASLLLEDVDMGIRIYYER